MLITLFTILYAIAGSLLYVVRGGGFGGPTQPGVLDIANWLKSKGLPKLRNLYIVALFLLPVTTISFLMATGFSGALMWTLLATVSIGYVASFVFGWGTYFDMGTWTEYYRNHTERPEIDWVLFKIFGPLWIPNNAVNPDPVSYDLIQSPTGDMNPYEWRRNRDYVGMTLRMFYSIVLFGSIAAVKYYFVGGLVTALITTGLFLPFGILSGLIYRTFVIPDAPSSIWRHKSPIGKSELVTGFVLHLLIAIAIIL